MSQLSPSADATRANGSAVARGDGQQPRQYLTFVSSGETFAIGILAIKEIIEFSPLTPVPMTPEFVRGIMNLRGAVVPAVDLAVRFARPASPVSRRTCIVIVEAGSAEERLTVGIIVDAVNAVVEIDPQSIEPPPAFGANVHTDFIEGMAKINERFVVLLDVNRIVAMDDMLATASSSESSGEKVHDAPVPS
jgi:purine-binding chemotaxis protein CheW